MFRPKPKINMPQNQAAGVSVLEATAVQRRCPNTSIIGQKRLYSDYCIKTITIGFSAFIVSDLVESCVTFEELVEKGKFHTSFSPNISILYPSSAMTWLELRFVQRFWKKLKTLFFISVKILTILIRQLLSLRHQAPRRGHTLSFLCLERMRSTSLVSA